MEVLPFQADNSLETFQILISVSSPGAISLVTPLCPTHWNIWMCHFSGHYVRAQGSVTLTVLVGNREIEPSEAVGADVQSRSPLSRVLSSTKIPKPGIINYLDSKGHRL